MRNKAVLRKRAVLNPSLNPLFFFSSMVAIHLGEVDLARASLYNSLKFRIPGSTLSSAVSSSSATSVQLEIKVQITNWLGLSHTTSALWLGFSADKIDIKVCLFSMTSPKKHCRSVDQ